MHYYHAFRTLVQDHLGRELLRILKPSTTREAFLGFDQGFVRCDVSAKDFERQLRDAIASSATSLPTMYVGYFLQFKRPEEMVRRVQTTPGDFTTPYYRFELSLKAGKLTGLSQHETLLRLHEIQNADVSYACPMLFTEDDLHREPSLDDVQVVSVSTAPPGYLTTERHFVAFRAKNDPAPVWCSDPVPGKALSLSEWFRSLRLELMSPAELLDWLQEISRAVQARPQKGESWAVPKKDGRGHAMPRALTILEIGAELQREVDAPDVLGASTAAVLERRELQRQRALEDPSQGI